MPIKFDTTLMRLVKDVNEIKSALRKVTTNLPLYDIANENTPASLSTDQDDYVPGNYDVLRLNATADITITGIANGKKGRFLEVINIGSGRITFTDDDSSSLAENRISTPYDQAVTILTNARVRFYYDSTQERWIVSDPPNIQGAYGKRAILRNTTQIIKTVNDSSYTIINPNTVVSDEWGYWDAGNGWFEIPAGESGMYSITINMDWFSIGTTDNWVSNIYITRNGTPLGTTDWIGTCYFQYNTYTGLGYSQVNRTFNFFAEEGDTIRIYAYQASSTPHTRDLYRIADNAPVYTFVKVS